MLFSQADRARIAAAIADAESRTAGEIVVIVSTAPQRYPATALSIAVLAALVLPLIAVLLGWSPAVLFADWGDTSATGRALRQIEAFVAVQTLVFGFALALVQFGGLARRLTPHGLRRDRVHRDATLQFKARGLEATAGRTGILIYVDEPEHVAEIIADEGIFTRVAPDDWADTITALTDGIKAGRAADGMVEAIARAGAVLAQHVPVMAGDINELPDGLIEI
ncbi:hypothetical protein [Sandarakinorhabdus sp.]|uniref:TPM domain-containing protein n=1 Tax=Sandarakinorhabdus sp. TaxID=1916663 RepID=UPI00286E1378|nr:hypothetical protein [Sandarakinorhabdus sp.]